MSFEGFPDEGLVFYEGLEADNSKTYWTRHKAAYDEHVKAPLLAMLEELAPEFGTAKVFRPYRDVRFSHDKTPYKTHQGACLVRAGVGRRAAGGGRLLADGVRPGRPLPPRRRGRRPGTAAAIRGGPPVDHGLVDRRRVPDPGARRT